MRPCPGFVLGSNQIVSEQKSIFEGMESIIFVLNMFSLSLIAELKICSKILVIHIIITFNVFVFISSPPFLLSI